MYFVVEFYVQGSEELSSSRTSLSSSLANLKKSKKNTVAPVLLEEETSFASKEDPVTPFADEGGMRGLENPTFEKSDMDIPNSGLYNLHYSSI